MKNGAHLTLRFALVAATLLLTCLFAGCVGKSASSTSLTPQITGTAYYVDCAHGDDNSSGLFPTKAWRTLDKVNSLTYAPGDGIFFKRGSLCSGVLSPQGSGKEGQPISLGDFGSGPLPVINGSGSEEAVVKLNNQEYWHIQGLEVIGGRKFGILITGSSAGILHHFRLNNLIVHDVWGGKLESKASGLVVFLSGNSSNVFDDVVVDGVTAYNTNQWAGVEMNGAPGDVDTDKPLISTHVTFRNLTVHNVYGDGIVLWGVQHGLIETSVAYDTGQQPPPQTIGTPASIWTWSCFDCTVQFNESYRANSPDVDAGCYDIDWSTRDNLYQYNYGHDCAGYCFSVFGTSNHITSNAVIRYNICANNGRRYSLAVRQGDVFISTWSGGKIDGVQIYNNTFYWNPGGVAPLLTNHAAFTGEKPVFFKNNIIYSTVPWLIESDETMALDHNLYWYTGNQNPVWTYARKTYTNFTALQKGSGQETHGIFSDPMLNDPGYHEAGMSAFAYTLQAGSPAIDSGVDVGGMGNRDFFGKPIPFGTAFDIGASEWQGDKHVGSTHAGGNLAPDFSLAAARGGIYRLEDLRGSPVLLSFLNIPVESTAAGRDASRSQMVFLRSLYEQYRQQGVRMVIVAIPGKGNAGDWINFSYDWQLDSVPVLAGDSAGSTARKYGVLQAPTTFLISVEGYILRRWDGLALPYELVTELWRLL